MTNTTLVGLGVTALAGPFASETCLPKKVNVECTCLNHNYHGVASR